MYTRAGRFEKVKGRAERVLRVHSVPLMIPFDKALGDLGLAEQIRICPVQSGYPSPKLVNLVLRQVRGKSYLFEASAARDVSGDPAPLKRRAARLRRKPER